MRDYKNLLRFCNHALYDLSVPQIGGLSASPIYRNTIPGAPNNALLNGSSSHIPRWIGDHTAIGPQDDANSWYMCTTNIGDSYSGHFFHVARVRVPSLYLFRGRDGFGAGWSMLAQILTTKVEFTNISWHPLGDTLNYNQTFQAGSWHTVFLHLHNDGSGRKTIGVNGSWKQDTGALMHLRGSTIGLGFNNWNGGIQNANIRIWGCGLLTSKPSDGDLMTIHKEILALEAEKERPPIILSGSPVIAGYVAQPVVMF